jgi:hypothetical protein
MGSWGPFILGGAVLAQAACSSDRLAPASMRVVVLSAAQLPAGDKWNELLGRPLKKVSIGFI